MTPIPALPLMATRAPLAEAQGMPGPPQDDGPASTLDNPGEELEAQTEDPSGQAIDGPGLVAPDNPLTPTAEPAELDEGRTGAPTAPAAAVGTATRPTPVDLAGIEPPAPGETPSADGNDPQIIAKTPVAAAAHQPAPSGAELRLRALTEPQAAAAEATTTAEASAPKPRGEPAVTGAELVRPQITPENEPPPLPATPEPAPARVTGDLRPTAPPSPAAQIAQALPMALAAPDGSTEILLSPEELGSLRIELRGDADRVTLVLQAERPDTLDLMRRHADRLAAELKAAGYAQVDMDFGQWSERPGQGPAPRAAMMDGDGATTDIAAAVPPPALRPTMPPSGLYLRI